MQHLMAQLPATSNSSYKRCQGTNHVSRVVVCCCEKILGQRQLEEGFVLVHSAREQPIMMEKSCQQGLEQLATLHPQSGRRGR